MVQDIGTLRDELRQVRLDHDWTYEQLADAIGEAVEGEIDAAVVYRFINEPAREPFERTAHKIRRFLEGQRKPARRKRA